MFFFLLMAAVAAAAAGGEMGPGWKLQGQKVRPKLGTLKGKSVKPADDCPQYVDPVDLEAEGYQAVYTEYGKGVFIEWGACFYQWHQDLRARMSEEEAMQRFINVVGKLVDWTLGLVVVVKWLIDRLLCFRMKMSALEIKIVDGPRLYGPSMPTWELFGGGHETCGNTVYMPGWNPHNTARVGVAVVFPEWPLEWPPPNDWGAAWVKNLGDVFDVGHDVWHVVSQSFDVERSWVMMSESGWRAVLRIGRRQGGTQGVEGLPYDVPEIFDAWKAPGQVGVDRGWSTKKKAENRYK